MDRIILHCDLNSFFASVEEIYRPDLKHMPMAVAGDSEQRHGIILAKNIYAKKYNIKTAEPIWKAKQKCPELIIIPPSHHIYYQYSVEVKKIYSKYTDYIESFGIDECWLDITASYQLFGSIYHCAFLIKEEIKEKLGLTISIGISYNKIYAKLGSDYNLYDQITFINRTNKKQIIYPLKASAMLFIGKKTYSKLKTIGIITIGDLAKADLEKLVQHFGNHAIQLKENAQGNDCSLVKKFDYKEDVKSIGHSVTTPKDINKYNNALPILSNLSQKVAMRAREKSMTGKVIMLTYKTNDLKTHTHQLTLDNPTNSNRTIFKYSKILLKESCNFKKPLRLLGVTLKDLNQDNVVFQANIFDVDKIDYTDKLERTMDLIRKKYGYNIVNYALNEKNSDE